MKKFLALILTFLTAFGLFACGSKEDPTLTPEYGIADMSRQYGVCYEMHVRYEDGNELDVDKEIKLLKNLGVTSMRFWLQTNTYLYSPTRVNEEKCARAHNFLAKLIEADIMVVGVNHTNFNNGTNSSGKPARDLSNGSYYVEWLEDYYTTWKTLVTEFPEVTYWEIDNEVNNTDFMKNQYGESLLDQQDMADVATDIFYYASRAIHDANPNAKSVMGGLVGLLSGRIKTFMEKLYVNIQSGEFGYFYGKEDKKNASKNADDYFEIACWHPYMEGVFSKKLFKQANDEIYEVILKNEKKHKKVIFSEVGFSNRDYKETVSAKYVKNMFEVLQTMPYVEQVHYYKMFDYADPLKYWTKTISRYGLFYDPDPSREYTNNENDLIVEAGAPKPAAYAFQEAAGGSGEINLNKIN
ncbi:MAG: hypothetical protein IJW58_00870 [Clostridia bacterium]|nr:hypothetical protein [Clostridia bacterium]